MEETALRHFRTLTLIAALPLALAACSSGDNGSTAPPFGYLRLANGIPDSGGLSFSAVTIPGTIGPVAFDAASTFFSAPAATYSLVLTPGDSGSAPFDISNVVVAQDDVTSVFGYGTLAAGTEGALAAEESLSAPQAGDAEIQPVHAAYQEQSETPAAAELEFYFVAPGTGASVFAGTTPTIVADFGPATPSQVVTISGGTYEIVVAYQPCLPPTQCLGYTEIFDSGPNGVTLPFANGSNVFQIAALDTTSAQQTQYGSPISLLLLDNGSSGSDDYTQLFNGQN